MKATKLGLRARDKARAERSAPTAPAPRLWRGLCLMFVRKTLDVPYRYDSAILAWHGTNPLDRHTSPAPPGVPEFFEIGKYGHVVLSDGNGWCFSNDIKRSGKIDRVQVSEITRRWGAKRLGWSETLNGVRVYPGHPRVSLSEVLRVVKATGRYPEPVASALRAEECTPTIPGYAKWQRRQGYRGRDADGYAGIKTLSALGRAHSFKVVP